MFKKYLGDFLNNRFVRGQQNRNDRIGALHRAWGHIFTNHIQGDYIEFGVYQGDSFIESYKQYLLFREYQESQLQSKESWRRKLAQKNLEYAPRFHGLDTFSGMPANAEGSVDFSTGSFESDYDFVSRRCDNSFYKPISHFLYKGLFSETKDLLLKNVDRPAAIINIDCDLYASTVESLDVCSGYMQVGTVILFDDYNCFRADNTKGQRRAFREFDECSNFVFEKWYPYHYAGQSFLIVDKKD